MTSLAEFDANISKLQELARVGSQQLAVETLSFTEAYATFAAAHKDDIYTRAVECFNGGELYAAEQACRLVLKVAGADIRFLHLLATIATRLGNHEDAADLLLDCLDINPASPQIRHDLANAFFKAGRFQLALDLSNELLGQAPDNAEYAALRAASLVKLGHYDAAVQTYEKMLETNPDDAPMLLRYGIALRIVGRSDDAIHAFRRVIDRQPGNGEAYWNLANLKTFAFEQGDVDAMRGALAKEQTDVANRVQLLFALGKAMNDAQQFDEAFLHYAEANRQAQSLGDYDPAITTELVQRSKQVFTREFFDTRKESCEAGDPIFIVGLPRSGSTLLEQILSNHSAIDATMELSEIAAMVRSLNDPQRSGGSTRYPGIVTELKTDELRRLGEEYLKRTRCFRGERRFFIDKAPHNFLHIGLIASILPAAKIIDARRNPLASGFSIYTQFFARGTRYAYDLQHIGRYYSDYLSLMDHWHDVLPGKILTVQYEDVVSDMEREVRRILEYCGLAFEPACLEFFKSKRAVATVSSEQVRQPIYSSALEHWKNYEKHLAPLRKALQSGTA